MSTEAAKAPNVKIPNFQDGILPIGDYQATLDELRHSVLVNGCGELKDKSWDKDWRNQLVDNLEVMVIQLWKAGISKIFIDGSFAEDKDHPNDIDGYFECDKAHLISGNLARELNLLDPHKIWIWDPATRKRFRGYPKAQLPMWHRYRVEFYPYVPGWPSGIKDKKGNILDFAAAFRLRRSDDKPKGIIQIIK